LQVMRNESRISSRCIMSKNELLTIGEDRTQVTLLANKIGSDFVIYIYNQNAHIGAVAVADYEHTSQRTSVSVMTRLGHKDDAIAQKAAYLICKSIKKPVCVIAGIHLDDITKEEIEEILAKTEAVVGELIDLIKRRKGGISPEERFDVR
jgi:hypothetical protein